MAAVLMGVLEASSPWSPVKTRRCRPPAGSRAPSSGRQLAVEKAISSSYRSIRLESPAWLPIGPPFVDIRRRVGLPSRMTSCRFAHGPAPAVVLRARRGRGVHVLG